MRRKKVQFRIKSTPLKSSGSYTSYEMDEESTHPDDLLVSRFEEFGTTPPRTRMKIKTRDWERKQKANATASIGSFCESSAGCNVLKKGMTRTARCRVFRRNTMDCALLHEMFVNEESRRSDKRAQDLLRYSERDLKQSLGSIIVPSSASSASSSSIVPENYRARLMSSHETKSRENLPLRSIDTEKIEHPHPELLEKFTPISNDGKLLRNPPKLIESCNRYMSVSSRPIGCRSSAPPSTFMQGEQQGNETKAPSPAFNVRKEFHETFANLIKLGSVDRQESKLSHEEHIWQTELKDLIWLELQACQADRSLEQQDKYLFTARQCVPDLLTQIINYKFYPRHERRQSVDSGLGSAESNSKCCTGCMSLYCKDCMSQQEIALKEVEELLTRLDAAESLYPSSQAMGLFHPIYKSESFVGRIKAMCLWYNITKQNQLKLCILGKILVRLQGNRFSWPVQTSVTSDSAGSSSSGLENDDCSSFSENSTRVTSTPTFERKTSLLSPRMSTHPKVSFLLNDVSYIPGKGSASSNSYAFNEMNQLSECHDLSFCKNSIHDINIFSVEPLGDVTHDTTAEQSSELYRKFIENVLKSRGLAKSLAFLNKLHNVVLYKAHIALQKPDSEDYDFENEILDEDVPRLEPQIDREQIGELRRYGYWSSEARSLNLPSYIPTFVFLSGIPLQFMHEFLRMRLETRVRKPNPLSLEQLMKELREGLTLALTHRERYQRHLTSALMGNESVWGSYMRVLSQFDNTVRKVFEVYLDYIDQLVLEAAPENHKKSALEREWIFTKLISPMINGMHILAAQKFCTIVCNLLRNISDRLVNRANELDTQIDGTVQTEESELKWQLLGICRETQSLFTEERERSAKVLFFAKTFCRDVETIDFHREHYEHYLNKGDEQQEFLCPEIKKAFKLLQKYVLEVRNKLMKIIERVQERCCPQNMLDLDESDRLAVLSRTREILHQGYKFGFEYNKDVLRLFEQRIMVNKNEDCDTDMALGIIAFAKMWMRFVTERCERGRGMRPRWASQGLEFLILACDPQITRHLDEIEFEQLKKTMDCCISHVIGITSEPEKIARKKASPRTRKATSPATSRSRTPTRSPISAGAILNSSAPQSPQYNKYLHPQFSLKEEVLQGAPRNIECDIASTPESNATDVLDFQTTSIATNERIAGELRLIVPPNPSKIEGRKHSMPGKYSGLDGESLALRQIRLRDAVNRLDFEIEANLRERNLIGHVKVLNACDKIHIRARSVNFRWHRGIKIGQGRFGKVYTAVNNVTGELMAMKEIPIQPGETRALKNVAEELKILEGIKHENLVRYYGVEIHREELLIFMELCSEGTLEALVELTGGLPEGLTRRFTAQLLLAVAELHKHGIVHRDIKTANIFLVDGSNSLKLGDFGSAVKIQAHTTIPGELQEYVGTQAYMAPEIFTKTNEGHGRAADIWSVGCVVVEMSSGTRPWAQFDSNFQIMFKVGMGEKPEAPETLSQEGHAFIEQCLQHDPRLRKTALELLEHNFCKVVRGDDLGVEKSREQVRRSFRRRAKPSS